MRQKTANQIGLLFSQIADQATRAEIYAALEVTQIEKSVLRERLQRIMDQTTELQTLLK